MDEALVHKIEDELRAWVTEPFGNPFSMTAFYNRQLDANEIYELSKRLAIAVKK